MKNVYIHLEKGALVKQFINTVQGLDGRFELHSDRTILDARSILGVYGLDLSSPLLLIIENDCDENLSVLEPFIIDNSISKEETAI